MQNNIGENVQKLRWLVLVMMGFVIFGLYYAYDSVVPISDAIINDMGITKAQYGLLFSYYSLPNLVMVLLGGILLDRIGIRKAGAIFAAIGIAGVLITAASSAFWLMLFGRLLYGIGAESLCITEIKVLSKWFRGKELAFAFGLNITLVRLGNFASLNLSAPIHTWSGSWRVALWVAFFIIFASMIVFLIYSRLDKKKEPLFKMDEKREETDKFVFRDMFKFNPSYWYVTFLCVTFYSAVLPFVAFSNVFLKEKYGFSEAQGGFYASLIFVATITITPLFGILVDKIGRRATIMMVGSIVIVPVYLALGFTSFHPALPIIGIGIAFSLVPSALWSSIPILVEQKRLGTAFGLIALVQNVGLTVFPWLAGKLTDLSGGEYTNTMILFALLGFVGLVFSLLLKFSEKKKGTGIELPTKMAQAQREI
ncbi:MAG: MFS transporter [Candidatus Aminicenantes bacterium]|nr:MAG: MFS transporter [Candidatus Aminicenantes bacterium]